MASRFSLGGAVLLLAFGTTAEAATIVFDTDPFQGTTALTTPGRQVVGGEPFLPDFSVANDDFAFDPAVFGIDEIFFVNAEASALPASGVNVVVLRSLDDDANSGTPFTAGSAASLIASVITEPGPGVFVYFNSGLGMPRLVYSIDLSDPSADLKILARLTGFAGAPEVLASFTQANFTTVPEPSSVALACAAVTPLLARRRRSRERRVP